MSMQQMLMAGGGDPVDAILANALAYFPGSGISGTGSSIALANAGTGGGDFDFNVPQGTTSNLTQKDVNGQTVVESAGAAGIETTAGQLITTALTLIVVAKFDADGTVMVSARSDNNARCQLYSRNALSGRFSVFAGIELTLSEAFDTDPHVWIVQYQKDANTKLTVDGVGTVTGNAGSQDFDFATLFANASNDANMDGWIGSPALWDDGGISDSDADLVAAKFKSMYGI